MLGGLVGESQRARGGGCGGVVEARDGTLVCSEPPSVPVKVDEGCGGVVERQDGCGGGVTHLAPISLNIQASPG